MLLSDSDPLSLRAPIVGVWVSGSCGGGSPAGGEQGPRPSLLLRHPCAYPACLRFLTRHERSPREKKPGASPSSASSPAAFLVLHLTGGISGGVPAFFEASAVATDGSRAVSRGGGARGGGAVRTGLIPGFEQLDFSASVDVVVGEGRADAGGDGEAGRRRTRQRARESGSNRTLVIGRLRRVSNPVYAEPFRRAQESLRWVVRVSEWSLCGECHPSREHAPFGPSPA